MGFKLPLGFGLLIKLQKYRTDIIYYILIRIQSINYLHRSKLQKHAPQIKLHLVQEYSLSFEGVKRGDHYMSMCIIEFQLDSVR